MKIKPADQWHEELGSRLFIKFSRDEEGNILGEEPTVEFASGYTQIGFNIDEWEYFLDESINCWFLQAERIETKLRRINEKKITKQERKIRNLNILIGFLKGKSTAKLGLEYGLREDHVRKNVISTAVRTALDTCGLKANDFKKCVQNTDYRANSEAYIYIANKALEFIKCEK